MKIRLSFRRGRDTAVAGDIEVQPDRPEKLPSSAVRVAIEVKQAAAEFVEFGHSIRSLGLASWTLGVGFAAAAMGLRFLNGSDMATPEFISCFVFASLLVIFGIVVYIMESRGYVKLVTEIAGREWTGPGPGSVGGETGEEDNQIRRAAQATELTTGTTR
jgi:hypothetical protein